MKKQILTLVIIFFSTVIFAQEAEEQSNEQTAIVSKHAVGIAAGSTIGCGLAYQYTYSKYSAQFTFLPYKKTYKEMYCLGLSFYYTLNQGRRTSLFLYQGNHYYYNKTEWEWEDWNGKKTVDRELEIYNNNSLGIGFDFTIFDNVSLKLMAGYASYNNFSELGLTGEIALLYHIPSKTK